MSIASRMRNVALQVSKKVKDPRTGELKDIFSFLANIDMDINFSNMSKIRDIEKYKDCEYIGITLYKEFDIVKTYRVIDGSTVYEVASINIVPRYTQLIMKVVVKDG